MYWEEDADCIYGFELCEDPETRDMGLCTTECRLYLESIDAIERERKKLKVLFKVPQWGRSYYRVRCQCGELFDVYIWSLHGCGKRCPKCKTKYGAGDLDEEISL